jgi:DNA polymerase-1
MATVSSRPVLYLIDALPYVFRAYFAIREMRSPQGHPVQAVYGFARFLLQVLEQEPLTHIGVAFDQSLTTSFRNDVYPAYKANRELPPPDLERQLAYCQAVTRALGMAVFVDHQYEADDLIGTLAHQVRDRGLEIVLVSNDKDLMQLVTPEATWYDFAKGRRFDPEGVTAHLGVRPEQIPDLLGLQGDAVDNIPGVRGIGAKSAVALLQSFRDLEALYADLDRVETLPLRGARALRQKLDAGREAAFLSRQLATIALDAPVRCDLDTLCYRGAVETEVRALFDELGFNRLRRR